VRNTNDSQLTKVTCALCVIRGILINETYIKKNSYKKTPQLGLYGNVGLSNDKRSHNAI